MNANSFFSSAEFGSMVFNSSYRSLTVETTSLLLNRLVSERDPLFQMAYSESPPSSSVP